MVRAEWIDKDGRGICGRCAAEAGLISKDENGDWVGLEPYDGEYGCWSCHQMIDEEKLIEEGDAMDENFTTCTDCKEQRPVNTPGCPTCITRQATAEGHNGWFDLLNGWTCHRECPVCNPE